MKKEFCRNCTYYSAYYKQKSDFFNKLNHGYCSKHEKPTEHTKTCELFKSNEQKEEMLENKRLRSLDQALTAIIEISQILKEKG